MGKLLKEAMQKDRAVHSGLVSAMLARDIDMSYKQDYLTQDERIGLHASAIIGTPSEFCLRAQVLSLVYKRNITDGTQFTPQLLRVFEEGDSVHMRWQNRFKKMGVADYIEGRGFSKMYNLYLTPDVLATYKNKRYIIEIKSCSGMVYNKTYKNNHPKAEKQLQLYMHFYGIPNGLIFMENKSTQEFRILEKRYDPMMVKPYIERLEEINKYYNKRRIPPNTHKVTDSICRHCAYSDACSGRKREKLKTE